MQKSEIQISEFVKQEEFQKLQDNWAKATGMSFVTVDINGNPVTKKSNFTPFCNKLRETKEYRDLCYYCDACGGRKARKIGRPYIYVCHVGLVDFAIPITIDGQYVGAILSGQVRVEDKGDLKPITAQNTEWMKDPEMVRLYQEETHSAPLDQIRAIADTIHDSYNYVIGKEYVSKIDKELREEKLKLVKEEKLRIEMEKSIKDIELKALHYQINPHFMFNVLNTIGRLAFFEGAKMTEDVVYAFSDMMRYILKKSSNQLGALRDEIIHVTNYLKIQKIRLGGRLQYDIDIPEYLMNVKVPFMCIQPIVENSIKYAVENKATGGSIHISAYQTDNTVSILVQDDGDGMTKERILQVTSGEAYHNSKESAVGLYNVDSRIKLFFGEQYGIEIESNPSMELGTKVYVKVPYKGKGFEARK